MQVAIIGAGNIGKALGTSLVRAGHGVTLAAAGESHALEAAGAIGATAAPDAATAAAGAEVVILAVPFGALLEVAGELDAGTDGKVVIDVTNPLTSDYSGLATAGGASAAERLAARLPRARVAKAFNTLFGSLQADPAGLGTRLDALYATDDDGAAATVADLAASIGFRPVRVGGLAAARELEAMAWLNIRLQLTSGGDWRSAFVLVGAPAKAAA